MAWQTRVRAIDRIGPDNAARWANPLGPVQFPAAGDASTKIFETPFYRSSSVTAYILATETAVTLLPGTGTAGVDRVEFASAPALGAVLYGTTPDGINVTYFDEVMLEAQEEIGALIVLCGWTPPEADATDVHPILKGWATDVTAYKLMVARPPLYYETVAKRYEEIVGEKGFLALARGNAAFFRRLGLTPLAASDSTTSAGQLISRDVDAPFSLDENATGNQVIG